MNRKPIHLQITLLFLLLGIGSFKSYGQPQQDIYQKTIDDINCAAIKLLLIGFDRPVAAKGINHCRYEIITTEVKKVKENQVKGYKAHFLKLAEGINAYKTKIDNPSEYLLYENTLEEVSVYAVNQFRSICRKYQAPNNTVCVRLSQKALQLEGEVNDLINKSLAKIGEHTYGGEKAKERSLKPPPPLPAVEKEAPTTPNEPLTIPAEKAEEVASLSKEVPQAKGGNSVLFTIILVLLIASVAWLYKENYELRDEIEEIKELLKLINKKK